jgi:hypothetical protein
MSLKDIAEKHRILDKISNPWIGSDYEDVRNAGTDATGKIGEELIYDLLLKTFSEYQIIWDKDKNTGQEDGVYDIKIIAMLFLFVLRLEVKTATQGNKGGFQHEKLLGKEFCDKIIFLDVLPNSFYITILDVEDIDFNGKEKCVLGRTLHIRSNSDQTKLDFGQKQIENGLNLGKTIYITDEETQKEMIKEFLIKNLINPHE